MPAFYVLIVYISGIFAGSVICLDRMVQIILGLAVFILLIELILRNEKYISFSILMLVFLTGFIRASYPAFTLFPSEWFNWFQNLATPVREHLLNGIQAGLSDDHKQLIGGIILGRGGSSIKLSEWSHFVKSGMSHLLVASGAQVSLTIFPIILIAENSDLSRKIKNLLFIIAAILLLILLLLVGQEPSILRAISAGYLYLAARLLNRRANSLNVIYVTALFWLWIDPKLIYNIGFQLSYSASWGLIYIFPRLRNVFIPKKLASVRSVKTNPLLFFLKYFYEIFLIGFSAQVSVIPILAYHFHRISLSGFAANLIALPVSELSIYTGLLSAIVGQISLQASMVINHLNSFLLELINSVAFLFSKVPYIRGGELHWIGMMIPYVFTGLFIEAKFRPHALILFINRISVISDPTLILRALMRKFGTSR